MPGNIAHCLGCDIRPKTCAGVCPCPVDGKSVREHDAWNLCQHPRGPRFGDGVAPAGWDAVPKVDVQTTTTIAAAPATTAAAAFVCGFAEDGRKLWGELHARELRDPGEELRWLAEFRRRIWCEECRRHWDEMLGRTPPQVSSPDAYFRWRVDRHNEVNRRLGKPELDYGCAARGCAAKDDRGGSDRAAVEGGSIDK